MQRAYAHAREVVLSGRVAPGGWLSEGDVATDLGISRTPVREAFLHLQADGFLRLHPRRGAQVVTLTARDVDGVLELREALEGFAAGKALAAGPQVTGPLIADLRAQVEAQRDASLAGDVAAFVGLDRALHTRVVRAADNPLLDGVYGTLRDRQELLGVEALSRDPARMSTILVEHSALVEALQKGDRSAYDDALRGHLASTGRILGRR